MCRAATHQRDLDRVVGRRANVQALKATRVRTAKLQPVILQRSSAADPDERRAPGLHSLGETTRVVSPRHDRALPARVQPLTHQRLVVTRWRVSNAVSVSYTHLTLPTKRIV